MDINTFKTEELLNNSLFIYRFLCIEKSNSTEELAKNLYYLISSETDEKHLNFLKEIIQYIFRKELKFNDFCKLMENIKDKKGGDENMVIDMVLKERDELLTRGRNEGRNEGRREGKQKSLENVTVEMLKQNLDDNFIMKITKINMDTLNKIKKKYKIK